MGELIRSEIIPGTVAKFRTVMQLLLNESQGHYIGNRLGADEDLVFGESSVKGQKSGISRRICDAIVHCYGIWLPSIAASSPERMSWDILLCSQGARKPLGYAGMEVYGDPPNIRVDFLDGYLPGDPEGTYEPIGRAFADFAVEVMIKARVKTLTAAPTTMPARIDDGRRHWDPSRETFHINTTEALFVRQLETCARKIGPRIFPSIDGWFFVAGPRRGLHSPPGGTELVFYRQYCTPHKRFTGLDQHVVSLEIVSPAPARIIVVFRSHNPQAQGYYDKLLTELEYYYPEMREARTAKAKGSKEAAEMGLAVEAQTLPIEASATTPVGGESLRPWEMIPDVGYDRLLLELWHKKWTAADIATRIGRQSKTVSNRLSTLRKLHGTDIVPLRR